MVFTVGLVVAFWKEKEKEKERRQEGASNAKRSSRIQLETKREYLIPTRTNQKVYCWQSTEQEVSFSKARTSTFLRKRGRVHFFWRRETFFWDV